VQVIGNGDARLSYISIFDVAQFVTRSIGNPNVRNAIIDLGGPDAVSPLEVIGIAERMTGKRFEVTHVPVEALQAQHAASTNPLEKTFAALMIEITKGDIIPMQDVLAKYPGMTLTSVEEYVKQAVGPIIAV
jgi:nucleoside-diphosphate-sugar epimerase